MTGAPIFLEGWLSVRAALVALSREVFEVLLERDKVSRPLQELQRRAAAQGVPVRLLPREELDARAAGPSHGGVLARVGPRRFSALSDLGRGPAPPFLAMLDGVEDPYNFGQALRSLYAAGAHGAVLRPRNWTTAAAVVARASAGASELLPMAIADGDEALVRMLRERGIRLVCADEGAGARPLDEAELSGPLLLAVGGERRGLGKALVRAADLRVRIPYGRDFRQSLGTAGACAVLAFEVLRQRRQPPKR